MQIVFDYVSVRSASTKSHRLKTRIKIRGRAWSDAFNAVFEVNKLPGDDTYSMKFIDANVAVGLEQEWRDALKVAIKAMARAEIERFVRVDIPEQIASSI